MKLTAVALTLGFAVVMTMAAPNVAARQNDVKPCVKGINGPDDQWATRTHPPLAHSSPPIPPLANSLQRRSARKSAS